MCTEFADTQFYKNIEYFDLDKRKPNTDTKCLSYVKSNVHYFFADFDVYRIRHPFQLNILLRGI